MNLNLLRQEFPMVPTAQRHIAWRLTIALLAAMALALAFDLLGSPTPAASAAPIGTPLGTPVTMNNHLYVPCSVSGCGDATIVINSHLYVPCGPSGCDFTAVLGTRRQHLASDGALASAR